MTRPVRVYSWKERWAQGGDAIGVLVWMDEPAFPECLVATRLLGVIAVAANSRTYGHLKSLDDLNRKMVDEIDHFFVSYNAAKGKKLNHRVDSDRSLHASSSS